MPSLFVSPRAAGPERDLLLVLHSPVPVAAQVLGRVQNGCGKWLRYRVTGGGAPMSKPAFGDYQLKIYGAGLRGVLPAFPMVFAELEARAAQALPPSVLSYVAGGAGDEGTQRGNVTPFARGGLMPRMFVGATKRDLSVELFGLTLPSPLFMAPVGVIGLCCQDGHG